MGCHLSTIAGTKSHCLVNSDGDVNFLGTKSLVIVLASRASGGFWTLKPPKTTPQDTQILKCQFQAYLIKVIPPQYHSHDIV